MGTDTPMALDHKGDGDLGAEVAAAELRIHDISCGMVENQWWRDNYWWTDGNFKQISFISRTARDFVLENAEIQEYYRRSPGVTDLDMYNWLILCHPWNMRPQDVPEVVAWTWAPIVGKRYMPSLSILKAFQHARGRYNQAMSQPVFHGDVSEASGRHHPAEVFLNLMVWKHGDTTDVGECRDRLLAQLYMLDVVHMISLGDLVAFSWFPNEGRIFGLMDARRGGRRI